MIEHIANSTICWAIILLALFCYQQVFHHYLMHSRSQTVSSTDNVSDTATEANAAHSFEFTGILIGALPLLGLLGTIVGLLDCFAGMASQGANSQLMSAGISDALLTTQLGLVCAVPGWLLQAWVKTKSQPQYSTPVQTAKATTAHSHEVRASYSANKPNLRSKKSTNNTSPAIDVDSIEAA